MSPFLWLISLSFLKYVYPVVSNRFYGTFGPYIYLSTLLNMLQALLHYVTMQWEIPHPEPFFISCHEHKHV